MFFNALPCTPVLTLSPPYTLYIISWYLRWDCWAKIHHTYFQQVILVTLKWFIPTVYSEINLRWPVDNCQPVGISKKWNAFSAWLCRMGSHHDRQSFCLPGHPIPWLWGFMLPPQSCILFHFVAMFNMCGLSIIELSSQWNKVWWIMLNNLSWPVKDIK